jgi:hypothetical protein
MTNFKPFLSFGSPFGEREAYEAEARGYLASAVVELETGQVPVVFYDLVRLKQDLDEECAAGRAFLAEPGLIVVDSVTMTNMEAAVLRLHEENFFESFRRSSKRV